MSEPVRVKAEALAQMLAEARRTPREECCGLLAGPAPYGARAGRDGVITTVLPAENALARQGLGATAYEIAPRDLFRLFREMRAAGLEHLGIYHSHPTGPNAPSPRDLERAYYPHTAYFILSPLPDAPRPVRAFLIRQDGFLELEIVEV